VCAASLFLDITQVSEGFSKHVLGVPTQGSFVGVRLVAPAEVTEREALARLVNAVCGSKRQRSVP
jgi:hypothetical protein